MRFGLFALSFILMEGEDSPGAGGVTTGGDGDAKTAAEIAVKIQRNLKDIRTRVDSDLDKYGKETAETKTMVEKAYDDVETLTKRLNDLETDFNRPGLGAKTNLDLHNKKAITAEMVTKDYNWIEENIGTKRAMEEDYAAVVIPPFMRDFKEMTPDQQKIYVANEQLFWKQIRRGGASALTHAEQEFSMNVRASVISDDPNAGFLVVPNEMLNTILGNIREFSPVRELADVRSGTSGAIEQPRRTDDIVAKWVAETGTRVENTELKHGLEKIEAHEHYVQLHASRQMLNDSAFNLESYFGELAGPAFAVLEGTAFISGTGAGQPEGIVDALGLATFTGDVSATIGFDDIRQIPFQIKEAYRNEGTWLWNRLNIARLMILKDTQDRYLWQPSTQAGQPSLLDGFPVRDATDLASTEAANDIVSLFGSFRRGYRVYDRMGMQVLRDPFSSKNTGLVEFDFYRRVGGGLILPEALIQYKLKA